MAFGGLDNLAGFVAKVKRAGDKVKDPQAFFFGGGGSDGEDNFLAIRRDERVGGAGAGKRF